jgi:uncharacterized protein (TIGR03067 family)
MLRMPPLFLACLLTAVAAADPSDNPNAALQGHWKMLTCNDAELRGDPDEPNRVTLIFDADNFTLSVVNEGGTRELTGGFSVDPTPTPQTIDFTVRGDGTSATILGIYRISGDRLTIRWKTNEERPGDFESPQVEFDTTLVFRREKSE